MSLEETTAAARRLHILAGFVLCLAAAAALWAGLTSCLVGLAYRPIPGYWMPGLAGLVLVGLGVWLLPRGVRLLGWRESNGNGRGFY